AAQIICQRAGGEDQVENQLSVVSAVAAGQDIVGRTRGGQDRCAGSGSATVRVVVASHLGQRTARAGIDGHHGVKSAAERVHYHYSVGRRRVLVPNAAAE